MICQVRLTEMNASEPLMRHRNGISRCRNHSPSVRVGAVARLVWSCRGGNRCIGGMTVKQALVWNMGTCRCDAKGASASSRNYEALSTDAQHRGGSARSSVETSVMEVERRG